jgi:cysteine synthase/rhodanese-related sulfurtransferase
MKNTFHKSLLLIGSVILPSKSIPHSPFLDMSFFVRRNKNVFTGADGIERYLNPENHADIPLVELPPALNPFYDDGIHIYAKLMHTLPLGNVKSLPALAMLNQAKKEGALKEVETIIENSSGNTVFSLAILARLFGIHRTKALVSHEVSEGKLQLLRLAGVEIEVNKEPICPDPQDPTSGIYKAKQLDGKDGYWNPGQYDNEANPRAHEVFTGPQIWRQLKGRVDVFCAGLGTTGTLVGTASFLKKKKKYVQIIGVVRAPNNPVPGVRTKNLLSQIAFPWGEYVTDVEQVGTKESFQKSVELCRAGLLVGPSAGFAYAGLLAYLDKKKKEGKLEDVKCGKRSVHAVFICPDSPLPYLEEYFLYLDESVFPEIGKKELLIGTKQQERTEQKNRYAEVTPQELYEILFPNLSREEIGSLLEKGDINLPPDTVILDVRTADEYSHAYIPGSLHIDHEEALRSSDDIARKYQKTKIYVYCKSGGRSSLVADALTERDCRVINLSGGMLAWSLMDFPRVRPAACKVKHGK